MRASRSALTEPCLMCVHAHPDDEVLPTGGILARYRAEGVKTVVVTCTDGRQGFAPGFANPGEPGHEPAAVAATRRAELDRSCAILGVSHLERLGYGDSGMLGWAANADATSFCNADLGRAAARLAALIDHYRPQVVVTYDERDGTGHPDHVMAHRVTVAAVARTAVVDKLYFSVRSAAFRERIERARAAYPGESPRPSSGRPPRAAANDAVTTVVETAPYALIKHQALAAHASQLAGSHWLNYPDPVVTELFSDEAFIRHLDRSGAPLPEDDLFAGLR